MEERYQFDNLVVLLAAVVQYAERDAGKGNAEAQSFLQELRSPVSAPVPLGRRQGWATSQWATYRRRAATHTPFRRKS